MAYVAVTVTDYQVWCTVAATEATRVRLAGYVPCQLELLRRD